MRRYPVSNVIKYRSLVFDGFYAIVLLCRRASSSCRCAEKESDSASLYMLYP